MPSGQCHRLAGGPGERPPAGRLREQQGAAAANLQPVAGPPVCAALPCLAAPWAGAVHLGMPSRRSLDANCPSRWQAASSTTVGTHSLCTSEPAQPAILSRRLSSSSASMPVTEPYEPSSPSLPPGNSKSAWVPASAHPVRCPLVYPRRPTSLALCSPQPPPQLEPLKQQHCAVFPLSLDLSR